MKNTGSRRLWKQLPALVGFILLTHVALGSGCSLNTFTTNQTAPVFKHGSLALDRESDLEFAREALPASLKTLETFLMNSPDNPDLLILLSRGFASYAFGILETDLEKAKLNGSQEEIDALNRRAVLHYLRSRDYGLRLLDYPELEKAALDGNTKKLKETLSDVTEDDVPALFWATYSWASAINLAQDDPDMVASLGVIEVLMNRVLALNPGYMYSSPRLFMGVFFASRPAMFGGNPEKSKEYFEQALRAHGKQNLLISFAYARYYCPQVQDRKTFNARMAHVLDSDPVQYPNIRLQNEIARERARFWVTSADEVFFE